MRLPGSGPEIHPSEGFVVEDEEVLGDDGEEGEEAEGEPETAALPGESVTQPGQAETHVAAQTTTLVREGLPDMTMGISPELDIRGLERARDAFERDVLVLRMTVVKDKKLLKDQRFRVEHARQMTRFFFGEVIGHQGLNRLVSLISVYNSNEEDELDRVGGIPVGCYTKQGIERHLGFNRIAPLLFTLLLLLQLRAAAATSPGGSMSIVWASSLWPNRSRLEEESTSLSCHQG